MLEQTYYGNATKVIADVKAELEELRESAFPGGMVYEVSYDVAQFLGASIGSSALGGPSRQADQSRRRPGVGYARAHRRPRGAPP